MRSEFVFFWDDSKAGSGLRSPGGPQSASYANVRDSHDAVPSPGAQILSERARRYFSGAGFRSFLVQHLLCVPNACGFPENRRGTHLRCAYFQCRWRCLISRLIFRHRVLSASRSWTGTLRKTEARPYHICDDAWKLYVTLNTIFCENPSNRGSAPFLHVTS